MRIYLVRHGMPIGADKGRRYLGRTDEPLCSDGKDQADITGKLLSRLEPESSVRIVSSPLKRSFETAEIINKYIGCSHIEICDALREIDLGIWDGKYVEDIKLDCPEEYEARGNDIWNYRIPGAETLAEAGARFCDALSGIIRRTSENALIITAHAGVIRSALALITDISVDEAMRMRIPYAGVIALSKPAIEKDGLRLEIDKIHF